MGAGAGAAPAPGVTARRPPRYARQGVGGASSSPALTHPPPPFSLSQSPARDRAARRALAAAADAERPTSLLAIAARAAAAAFSRWTPAELAALPPDVADALAGALLARGAATGPALRALATGGDQPLARLHAVGAPGVDDGWLDALVPGRLMEVSLDGASLVSDAGLACLVRHGGTLRSLSAARLRVSDRGVAATLARLPALSSLALDGCDVGPVTIAACARLAGLTRLSLHACWSADGVARLAALDRLVDLDLGWARATDDAAAEAIAASATGLVRVSVAGSRVGDAGAAALARLPRLASLNLSGCGRVGSAGIQAVAASAVGLTSLDASRTRAADAALACLAALPRLASINAAFTAAGDCAATAWGGSATLKRVDLDATDVTDAGIAALARAPRLTRVAITDCDRVTDAGLIALAAAPRLADLDAAFTRAGDAGVAAIASCASLTRLVLDSGDVTDVGVAALAAGGSRLGRRPAHPPPLACLDLGACRVTDAGAACLARLTTLTCIVLASGGISDAGLAALSRLPRLARLAVPHSRRVGDAGVARLAASAPGLTSLDLAGTDVTSAGVGALTSLSALRHLVTRGAPARPASVAALVEELPRLTDAKA
jgi:hypothetical protein